MLYMLHFERALSHARHYTGFAESADTLPARIRAHAKGQSGARLLEVIHTQGIGFHVSAIMQGDRTRERALKNSAHPERVCSHCKPQKTSGQFIDVFLFDGKFLSSYWPGSFGSGESEKADAQEERSELEALALNLFAVAFRFELDKRL